MRSAIEHGCNMMAWGSIEARWLGGWGYNILQYTDIYVMNSTVADTFSKKGYGCCFCLFVDRMVSVQ